MSNRKDPNDPSVTSKAHDFMAPKWERINTLLGGTDAMREAGRTYLPQHARESNQNYADRLHSTTLFNMLELTLDSLAGRAFSAPVQEKNDVPEQVSELLRDVDLQGNNVTTFARRWFYEGMAKGFAHVLVDMPAKESDEQRTLADDMREGRRPYMVLVSPENVLAMHAEVINGREHLTHVRIYEEVTVLNGFVEEVEPRIRVLEPGTWTLYAYQKSGNKKNGKRYWRQIDAGTTGVDFIPMVTFYANRQGVQLAKPPLDDLVHLNIRHWQSTSDQINILTVARFPMLAVSGATDTDGEVMSIGPRQLLGVKEPNGQFYYVEHSGKAIGAGRQDLLDLEEEMASYGAEFLKRQPGNATATGRALDSAEATSALQDHATRFTSALNEAVRVMGAWVGLDDTGTLEISTELGVGQIEDSEVKVLIEARKNGDLSREAFLEELKRKNVLAKDFDPRADIARTMMDLMAGGGRELARMVQEDSQSRTANGGAPQEGDDNGVSSTATA